MVSRDCWLKAGELGLLGCTTSDKYGGSGADAKYAAVVWEEQSYRYVSGVYIEILKTELFAATFEFFVRAHIFLFSIVYIAGNLE